MLLLIAFALRVVAIDQIPPGLSHDEAYNGVTAIQVLQGQHHIFFEINKGIEPLIIYLEAVAFYLFGIGPVQLRLVNICCGMLTVALIYPLTLRLFNRRVALLALAGVALSFWAIFASRLTLRAVTLPPLLLLTFYFLWRGLNFTPKPNQHYGRSALIFFILSGLVAGVTMYTYLSSRFVPLIIMTLFGYYLLRGCLRRQHWLGLVVLCSLWAMLFAPLASYYWENLASFTRRSNQVTVLPYALNGEFGPLLESTSRTLGMFTFQGDETARYNLDGRPIFDWGNGLLFYVGLGSIILRLWDAPRRAGVAVLGLGWLFFMLLPGFITDDSPHFLRTIGALPVVYIVWAIGLERIGQWVEQHTILPRYALLILMLTFTGLSTTYDYFWRWPQTPGARYIYGADIAAIANELKHTPAPDFPAISAEYYRDLDPFRLNLHFQGQPPFAIWFDGRQTLAFPPPQSGLTPHYFFAASAPAATIWSPFLLEEMTAAAGAYKRYTLADEATLRQAWATTFPPPAQLEVNLNNDLMLKGYQIVGAAFSGGKFQVLLGWQALRTLPPDADYTFLVRLRDAQGHIWTEADGNGYAPGDWQPGVLGLQLLTLRLPGDLPPRTYYLTVAVIDRHGGQALATTTGETMISLGPIVAHLADKPHPPNPDRLPNPTTTTVLNQTLMLRGYEVSPRTLRVNDTLILTLHWQVLKPPQQNYQLEFSLLAGEELVYRWSLVQSSGGEWPTKAWPPDYWVQDRLDLPLPANLSTGHFILRGQWIAEEGQTGEMFDLGPINIEIK